MSEQEQAAVAPEQPVSSEAAPVADTTAVSADSPVVGEESKPEAKETPKTFTQEDVDRIVSKEKARTERKLHKDIDQRIAEALQKASPQPAAMPDAPQKPKPDQFQTTEEYVEALTEFKADEIYRTRSQESERNQREQAQRQHHQAVVSTYQQRVEAATEKYPDFEDVAYSDEVPITNAMAVTIQESEMGPDIAYYLGKNVAEAQRIAKLSPFLQAKELGKLEAKIAAAPAPAKPSSAPEPINPIRTAGANTAYVDTLDPKSLDKLGTSAWIDAERKRQTEKWKRAQG